MAKVTMNIPLCNHSFCYACIVKHLFHGSTTCPICRTKWTSFSIDRLATRDARPEVQAATDRHQRCDPMDVDTRSSSEAISAIADLAYHFRIEGGNLRLRGYSRRWQAVAVYTVRTLFIGSRFFRTVRTPDQAVRCIADMMKIYGLVSEVQVCY
jgi:hypothetical protein